MEHHHGLGVSTFYVFDHASNPPLTEVLVEYIGEGIVQYAVFDEDCVPPGCRPQLRIYQTCLDKVRPLERYSPDECKKHDECRKLGLNAIMSSLGT